MLQFGKTATRNYKRLSLCVCVCVYFFVLDNIAKWKLTDSIAIRFDQTDGSKWEKEKNSLVCV